MVEENTPNEVKTCTYKPQKPNLVIETHASTISCGSTCKGSRTD